MGGPTFIMESYVLCNSVDGGQLTIPLDKYAKAIMASSKRIEIRIRPLPERISEGSMRYYRGIYIPNIIVQYRELNGKTLSMGEVDVMCKKDANNGTFRYIEIDGKEAVIFDELHVSQMTKEEFKRFIANCDLYWSALGITPPDDNRQGT
jgi:hypothetical protein